MRINPEARIILISKPLRDKYFTDKKVNILIDEEEKLLGLKPAENGYRFDGYGRIKCRAILEVLPAGMYPATWNAKTKVLIVDLKQKL